MIDPEINIAIAEWCGWKVQHEKDDLYTLRSTDDRVASSWRGTAIKSVTSYAITYSAKNVLPSYATDLNAMHEAQEKLNQAQRDDYLDHLEDMGTDLDTDERWFVCDATARQRAEALLRTVGKWKE